MILRARHLREERLLECYLAARQGENIDPPAAEHLTDCEACAARYTEFAQFMDEVHAAGEAEANDIFTPERLRAQQQQIARRLETLSRPARVISFPAHTAQPGLTVSAARNAPRWAAAAAALFIGIALGASYRWESRLRGSAPIGVSQETATARANGLTPVATRGNEPADVAADDAFLSELDVALDRPHTRELMAIDAFTPHFREIRNER